MLQIHDNESAVGSQYARTEEELYQKAIALLEKCKIEPRHSGQEIPEPMASLVVSEHPGNRSR